MPINVGSKGPRAPNPACWPFRALHAPKAPQSTPLSVTPLPRGISWSSRSFNGTRSWECWSIPAPASWAISREDARVDVDAARAFRLPGDSIDRARFSAGRAGPFLKEMVGELSRCPTNPFDQDQCINFDQDQCINGHNVRALEKHRQLILERLHRPSG